MLLKDLNIGSHSVLLLDRDGVINKLRHKDYVKVWEEFEFLPCVKETIAKWSEQLKYIFVVTNQRGVSKGKMTEEALIEVHRRMVEEIENAGGFITRIYYCTALTDEDYNRKPNPGMFHQIQRDYPDVQQSDCVMIGDSKSDEDFAKNCGIDFIYSTNEE